MAIDFTKPAIELTYFVHVELYDRDAGTTLDLYMGSTEATTKVPDGTMRHWMGRLSGGKAREADPQLYQSTWKHPTFTCAVTTADDSSTSFWETYLDPDIVWRGRPATVYACDLGSGQTQTEYAGTVTAGPDKLRKGESFRFNVTAGYPDVKLPNPPFSVPSETFTGFIQPRYQDGGAITLNGAVNATDTTWTLNNISLRWIDRRVVVCEDEIVYITSNDQVAKTIDVIRGYAKTTPASHADLTAVHVYRNGPLSPTMPSGVADTVLPYVFGNVTGTHRGIVLPLWAQGFNDVGVTGNLVMYTTRGINRTREFWYRESGGTIITALAIAANQNFNDHDDADTNCLLDKYNAGSYIARIDVIGLSWHPDTAKAWARMDGIANDELETGLPHRYPCGIAQYLATNSDWACGLSSVFTTGLITAWNDGAWKQEYTEEYAERISGIIPAVGSTTSPKLVDALQELCWIVGSDLFYRAGKLHPKRRTVESTADFTVESRDLQHEFPEMENRSKDYANMVTFDHGQDILAKPDTSPIAPVPDNEALAIPYSVIARDDDEVTANDDVEVTQKLESKWWWFELSADWDQSSADDQISHLDNLRDSAEDHLAQLAQPQIHLRTKLTHRHWNCYQGMTIEYDVDGYTTRKGQVRARTKDYDAGTIEIVSWHIEF
jgi:hypothetical protein